MHSTVIWAKDGIIPGIGWMTEARKSCSLPLGNIPRTGLLSMIDSLLQRTRSKIGS